MDIIYVLVPLSLALLGIAVLIFFWAVKGGQFDDLDSPAHRILFDDDDHLQKPDEASAAANIKEENSKLDKQQASATEPNQDEHNQDEANQ